MVDGIKKDAAKDKLHFTLLFMCADNSTVKGTVIKGSSLSPRLFKLVKDLKQAEMNHSFMTHMILASSRRMMQQGTDGVSRGELRQALSIVRPI